MLLDNFKQIVELAYKQNANEADYLITARIIALKKDINSLYKELSILDNISFDLSEREEIEQGRLEDKRDELEAEADELSNLSSILRSR